MEHHASHLVCCRTETQVQISLLLLIIQKDSLTESGLIRKQLLWLLISSIFTFPMLRLLEDEHRKYFILVVALF